MSFLKKLFGGRSPAERVAEGQRLLARGEPGLARLELTQALASSDLLEDERVAARAALARADQAILANHLATATALFEAGDLDDARSAVESALELARSSAPGTAEPPPPEIGELEKLAAAIREASRRPLPADRPVASAAAADEDGEDEDEEDEDEEDEEDDGGPEALAPEGDDELSPLEVALLVFPAEEGDRLRALATIDPALAEALALQAQNDPEGARNRFLETREPALSDPLVRRETARAALRCGDAEGARVRLEPLRAELPEDPETLELLLEAYTANGDTAAAGTVAREMLSRGFPGDFFATVGALINAGAGEEALQAVDKALNTTPRNLRLWEIRGALCERMGSAEGLREADENALQIFESEMSSRGAARVSAFPLAAARRLASARAEAELSSRERGEFSDLLRLLIANDPEGRRRWRALLKDMEG